MSTVHLHVTNIMMITVYFFIFSICPRVAGALAILYNICNLRNTSHITFLDTTVALLQLVCWDHF